MNNTDFIADFDIEELEDRLEAIGITPYGIDPNCTGCCSKFVILAIPPLPVALRKCWMRINMKPW